MPKQAVLVVSSRSRRGKDAFFLAQKGLADCGFELTGARLCDTARELGDRVQEAIAARAPLVIVGGGDGTLSSVAGQFVGSESTLGIIPMGTGNAFARDLGVPLELNAAIATIAEGKRTMVDLGRANGEAFLNVASIGLTTRIAQGLTNPMKKRFGRFVYLIAVAEALAKVQPFHVRLEAESGEREFETLLLVIGNGRYHAGPFLLAPNASIISGRLALYALATTRKSAFLRFAFGLATGRQGRDPEVLTESPLNGSVVTTPTKRVTVDGEIRMRTPLSFAAMPRALPVIVPQDFDG